MSLSSKKIARVPRRSPRRGSKPTSETRRQLVAKLWSTAERQVNEIEQRLAAAGEGPSDRDRDRGSRALAVLVKTLRELAAFDEAHPAAATRTDSEDDDSGPRDIDEFRRELVRKMDALIARREARIRGEPETRMG